MLATRFICAGNRGIATTGGDPRRRKRDSDVGGPAYGEAPTFSSTDTSQFKRAVDMTDDELAAIASGPRFMWSSSPASLRKHASTRFICARKSSIAPAGEIRATENGTPMFDGEASCHRIRCHASCGQVAQRDCESMLATRFICAGKSRHRDHRGEIRATKNGPPMLEPRGDPRHRKRDSDVRGVRGSRHPPTRGMTRKRQIIGDLQQDVCLICGHQEGGREPPPGTTSHPKPVKGGLKCATEQLPHT